MAIVGGGPAGAATALFLCHLAPALRDRIVLIDKATFPRDKICAGAIGARADRLLETIGVHIPVPSVATAGLQVSARCGTLTARLPGRPIARVVRRIDYDAALLDQVREQGVEVRDGVALEALERRATGVELSTTKGALSARAVVGADGVGSTVRRSIGLPRGRYHAQAVEVDTPWTQTDRDRDLLCFDIVDDGLVGYAWDFPTRVDGASKVCRGVYRLTRGAPEPHLGAPRAEAARLDIAERLAQRLRASGIDPAGLHFRRYAERGLAWHEPCAVSRVALVGEAANIDPVLGEGIAQAIFYGKTAADYLAACAERGDYRFGDYRAAVMRSPVGRDLRIRAAMVRFIYGPRRPLAERWVVGSRHLAVAGISYFSGRRVPRKCLWGAAVDLATSAWPPWR